MPDHRYNFSADHDACGVGFIAQLGGPGSHEIVERALTALARLAHRGGVDADGRSGDGAGLLTAIPESLLRKAARGCGISLPDRFAVGMVFLPQDREAAAHTAIVSTASNMGLEFVGWRAVPTDSSILGPRSLESLPEIRQCFFGCSDSHR